MNDDVVIGRKVVRFEEVGSTNDVVKEVAEEGEAEGLVVIAESQAMGRGRRGRVWVSKPGLGVYLSALLRPSLPGADAAWLAMVAGVAAADAIERLGVAGVAIKWPNDVLVHGKKIAGVLVEPRLAGGKIEFAVVGIGVNVRHKLSDFPPELRKIATSLACEGAKVSRDAVEKETIAALDRWYRASRDGLQEAWSCRGGTERIPVVE